MDQNSQYRPRPPGYAVFALGGEPGGRVHRICRVVLDNTGHGEPPTSTVTFFVLYEKPEPDMVSTVPPSRPPEDDDRPVMSGCWM